MYKRKNEKNFLSHDVIKRKKEKVKQLKSNYKNNNLNVTYLSRFQKF